MRLLAREHGKETVGWGFDHCLPASLATELQGAAQARGGSSPQAAAEGSEGPGLLLTTPVQLPTKGTGPDSFVPIAGGSLCHSAGTLLSTLGGEHSLTANASQGTWAP